MDDGFDYSGLYFAQQTASAGTAADADEARRALILAQQDLARSEQRVQNTEEALRIANRRIWEISAESTAYRDLAQAMVYELHGDPVARELTIPDNRDARRAFFEKRKKEVADASEAANAHLKHF